MITIISVGEDIHKSYGIAAVKTEKGEILGEFRFSNSTEGIRYMISVLKEHGDPSEIRIALESTGNYWIKIYDTLEENGFEVVLVNPAKTKAIADEVIKNDKLTADVLADLLRGNFISKSYIPPKPMRDLRSLMRYRVSVVQGRTRCKNRIHMLIDKHQLKHQFSDLFGKSGMSWLERLAENKESPLSDVDRFMLNSDLEIIKTLNQQYERITSEIAKYALNNEKVKIPMSIKGIDFYLSMLILAEIGDVKRFRRPEKLARYAGLVPKEHQSGKTIIRGRITKQGPRKLRWALNQAANSAKRFEPRFKRFYERVAKRRGPAKATVALEREILVTLWYMLTRNEPYRDCDVKYWKQKLKNMERLSKK